MLQSDIDGKPVYFHDLREIVQEILKEHKASDFYWAYQPNTTIDSIQSRPAFQR